MTLPAHLAVVQAAAKTNNFLIPNGTFFFEWIVFILVLVFLARKVIPRITKMIDQRQATIKRQFDDAEAAKQRLEAAEKEYTEALAETRRDASRLREQAQAERAEIVEEARSEAQARVEEMLGHRRRPGRDRAAAGDPRASQRDRRARHDALRADRARLAARDARQRKLVADFIAGVGATETIEAEHAGTAPVESGN